MIEHIRRLFTNSLNYSVALFLTKGASFLLLPVFTYYLTPSDFGVVNTVGVLINFFGCFFLLNLHGAVERYYYDYRDNKDKLDQYIGTIVIFLIPWGLIFLAVTYWGARGIMSNISGVAVYPFVFWAITSAFLQTFYPIKLSIYRVKEESKKYAIFQSSYFVVSTLIAVLFVVVLRQGAEGRVYAIFLSSIGLAAATLYLLKDDIKIAFNYNMLINSIKFGLPLVPHQISKQVLVMSDRIFLNNYRSVAETGIYSVAYILGEGISMLLLAFNSAWVPLFYDLSSKEGSSSKKVLSQLTSYYIVVLIFLALSLSLFSREIIVIMTSSSYLEAYRVIPIISLGYVFQGLYLMIVNQIFFKEKTYWIPLSTVTAAVVNLGLNWLWIPKYGMYGAAWATALSYLISFLLTWIISHRTYPITYEIRALIPIIIGTVIAIIGYYLAIFNLNAFLVVPLKLILLICYAVLVYKLFFSSEEKCIVKTKLLKMMGG